MQRNVMQLPTEKDSKYSIQVSFHAAININKSKYDLQELSSMDSSVQIDLSKKQLGHPIYEQISSDDEPTKQQTQSIQKSPACNKQREELSAEEKRKIHSCSCTLKQRKRYYQYEIICPNID